MQQTASITPFRSPVAAVSNSEIEEKPKVFTKSFVLRKDNCVINMHRLKQTMIRNLKFLNYISSV